VDRRLHAATAAAALAALAVLGVGLVPAANAATTSGARPAQALHAGTGDRIGSPGPVTGPTAVPRAVLGRRVRAFLAGRQSTASVAVYDKRTGVTYVYRGRAEYDTASIVKVQILATLLRHAQTEHRRLTPTERSKATSMIRYSDNDAATWLWNHVGGGAAVRKVDLALGLRSTTPGADDYWGLTQTTAPDQARLIRDLAYGTPLLEPARRSFELGLMGSVTPSQRWGVSAGTHGATVQLKNGWLQRTTDLKWRINSIGHVLGGGRDYAIAVLSSNNPSMDYGIDTVQGVSRIVYRTLADPLT
jgi:beta-lactamase class A